MSKKLIITEKPSVAMDFARVLGVSNGGRRNGFLEGDNYVISWCYGHLVQMVYPENYDAKYKSWKLEDLPFLPKDYKYGVVESAKDQYKIVNGLLHREDIDTVYWAGDSGKEGQTIEENIRIYGGVREGMDELRVWIDSQTDEEMLRGIKEAKPMSDYALLGKSGIMRTIEDYSLGINFSRALSVKYGRMINDAAATNSYTAIAIGRVMTCVLGMVVEREREIRNFTETPFYKVKGFFSDTKFPGEWKATAQSKYFESPLLYGDDGKGFKARESAEKLIAELQGKPATIASKEVSNSKKKAPLLFNLAELQSECSKRFKISPAQTLDVIQELYEKKYTTYPRTDARVLTTAVAKEIVKNIRGLQAYEPTAVYVKNILDNKRYAGIEKTQYTDDSKVTDHYAVIPTGQCGGLDKLPPLHRSIYDLIVRRFLSIFCPPAEYKNVKLTIKVGDESFFASAKVLVKSGYLAVAGLPKSKNSSDNAGANGDDSEEDEETFSKEDFIKYVEGVSEGQTISVEGFDIKEGKTSPPKRYTSGNLILAMENAGKLIEDEELREQIKTTGIGTSATRGEIIDKLIRIKYLNLNNKSQIITPEKLGEMIYEVVLLSVPSLLSPEMTAGWEKGLEGIINGSVDADDYRTKLEQYIREETEKMIKNDLTGQIAANINQFTTKESRGAAARKPLGIKCPACGGELNTTGFGYGCSNYFNEQVKCKFAIGKIADVDIPEEEFRKLILEGKTSVIDGFKSKSKKKFKAVLRLNKDEKGEFQVAFDFSENPIEYVEDIKCPACGGRIYETAYGYSCENRQSEENACYFSIGEIAGKKIDLDSFKALINDGVTPVISGFKSKTNQKFQAKLRLKTDESGKKSISFDFDGIEREKLEGVVCPDCGGDIVKTNFGYGCANYSKDNPENSCRFNIGEIAGKKLSAKDAKALLLEGKTETIRGFKSKSGKKFDACLIFRKNEAGKSEIGFDFENVEAKKVKDVKCPICGGDIVVVPFGYGCSNYNKDDAENSCSFNIGAISGVKLKEAHVKELLTNGITSSISGFKSKKGTEFEAMLALAKDDNDKVTGLKFVFDNQEEVLPEVTCPKCGGSIIKNKFGYHCANNIQGQEDSCDFFISKISGKELTKEQVTKLLKEKKTDQIIGFTGKNGQAFDASLSIDENGKITFIFA